MKQYDLPYNVQNIDQQLLFRVKDSADWRCTHCGWKAENHERIDIIVHHINNNPLDDNLWNLKVLCRDCHDIEHGRDLPPKRARFIKQRKAKLEKKRNRPRRQYSENGWPI